MRKTFALALALALVLTSFAFLPAAAGEAEYKGEIKYLMGYTGTDPNEEPPAKKIEELTGYKVTYYNLPSTEANEKLYLELSSGAEYDVVRLGGTAAFYTLAPTGALVDMTDYLPGTTYLKDIMNELEWSAASIDGRIFGIPQFDAHYIGGGVAYNVQLWESAGFKMDEANPDRQLTLAEFTEILRGVKAQNPDVVPYVGNEAICVPIASAFGIVTHQWQYNLDGSIVYYFLHDNMVPYLTTMHDMYAEGLLDVEWPVNKGENIDEKFTSGKASSRYLGWASSTAIEASLAEATGGNTVDYLWATSDDEGLTRASSNAGVTGYAFIPTTSKQVQTVIDFLDLRADPDIFLESFLGVEGEQWEFRDTDNDGEMEYWPLLGEEYDPGFTAWFNGHYFNVVNSPESFTTMWLCRARKGPVQYAATVKTNGYPVENWVDSPLAYAPPMEAISKYSESLATMINDYIKEVIAGTRSVDEYEDVVAEFMDEGGSEMIEAVNAYVAEYADLLALNSGTIQDSNLMD